MTSPMKNNGPGTDAKISYIISVAAYVNDTYVITATHTD